MQLRLCVLTLIFVLTKPNESDYDMIQIGSVVVRGPDWSWNDQDGDGKGVVLAIERWVAETHTRKYAVRVKWDVTKKVNVYRYGAEDKMDVKIVGYRDLDDETMEYSTEMNRDYADERNALLSIYRAAGGVNWFSNNGWRGNETMLCNDALSSTWDGVVCKMRNAVGLDLSSNNAEGTLPYDSLMPLTSLESFTVANNRISGPIPRLVGSPNVRFLAMHNNRMSGTIPVEIGRLSELEWLSLYNNRFTGTIPRSIGGLNNLVAVFLQTNRLHGKIPLEFRNMKALRDLDLRQNQLTGSMPILGKNVNVRVDDDANLGYERRGDRISALYRNKRRRRRRRQRRQDRCVDGGNGTCDDVTLNDTSKKIN